MHGTRGGSKFFVHYFTRHCATLKHVPGAIDNCTPISNAAIPRHNAPDAFGPPALRGHMQVGIRDYIVPGTARGPDTTKMLTPVVLTFRKR